MNYEFNSYINGADVKIFLSNPLMNEKNISKVIHSHKYTEFHMVSGGNLKILIGNKKYDFSSGAIYAIPGGMYHCYIEAEPRTQIVAFQADMYLEVFKHNSVSESVIDEIINILKNDCFCSNCSGISALFSFVASGFFSQIPIKQSKDDAILIYEFISMNYNKNISISKLSEILCLSDKQTERLVKKYTGYTFKKAMMNYRMKVAGFLEKNTDMDQSEISQYVGYSNYSGYWKAKKSLCRNADGF